MDTIKSSEEISNVFSQGKRLSTPYLTLIYLRRSYGDIQTKTWQHDRSGRVAFIAGKKHGNAVWRNKAKRRMRSVCSSLGGPWINYDVIFLAKPSLTSVSYSKVHTACSNALRRVSFFHDCQEDSEKA